MRTFHHLVERDYEIEGPDGDGKGDFLCKRVDVTIIDDKVVVKSLGYHYWFDPHVDNGKGDHFPHESKAGWALEIHPAIERTIKSLIGEQILRLGDHEYQEIFEALEKLEANPPDPF